MGNSRCAPLPTLLHAEILPRSNFSFEPRVGRGPPSPPGFALSDSVEDVYDPGGGGGGGSGSSSLIPHHSPATPTSPAFSDGSNWRVTHSEVPRAVPSMDTRGELPFFVMIAPSCSLGGAEEGGAVSVECDDGGSMMNASLSTGGGGAVTPSMLPVLFPRESGCALSEGVRMVINVSEAEGTTLLSSSGEASTAMFSVHSVTSRDVIVKVSERRNVLYSRYFFHWSSSSFLGRLDARIPKHAHVEITKDSSPRLAEYMHALRDSLMRGWYAREDMRPCPL